MNQKQRKTLHAIHDEVSKMQERIDDLKALIEEEKDSEEEKTCRAITRTQCEAFEYNAAALTIAGSSCEEVTTAMTELLYELNNALGET